MLTNTGSVKFHRAKWLTLIGVSFLVVMSVLVLIAGGSLLYYLISSNPFIFSLDIGDIITFDTQILGRVQQGFYLLLAIWCCLHLANLAYLKRGNTGYKYPPAISTVIAFFLPFYNLYAPYALLKKLWQGSFAPKEETNWQDYRAPSFILIGWVTYVLGTLLPVIIMVALNPADNPVLFRVCFLMAMLFLLIAYFCLGSVMLKINKQQNKMA